MDEIVEQKARAAKDNKESSIRELADSIFANLGRRGIPETLIAPIKERLVKAEINYRQTSNNGVREYQVADMINNLATNFSAPDYAKTSPLQVRVLRMGLMEAMPSLISRADNQSDKGLEREVGSELKDTLSPLEAISIAINLIQQKMLNEVFQKTPDEFAASLKDFQTHSSDSAEPIWVLTVNPKANEMHTVVFNELRVLNAASRQNLMNQSLDILGIPQ